MSPPPPQPTEATLNLDALRFLPSPLIVLSSQKTVLTASEAMHRLLAWPSLSPLSSDNRDHHSATNTLIGRTLSQLNITLGPEQDLDMSDLDSFLDRVSASSESSASVTQQTNSRPTLTEFVEGAGGSGYQNVEIQNGQGDRDDGYDDWPEDDWSGCCPEMVVLVEIQRHSVQRRRLRALLTARLWFVDNNFFYLLTFTKSSASQAHPKLQQQPSPEAVKKAQKLELLDKMKRALFDSVQTPTFLHSADETIYYPNHAGKQLTHMHDDDYILENANSLLTQIDVWDEDFTRKLDISEYPGIHLIRNQQRFARKRFGFLNPETGGKIHLELSGDCLYDDSTGEFLGGVVWCQDITQYFDLIAQQRATIDSGFEDILDNMPNMIFTAKPDGRADYFSKRWFDYTGLAKVTDVGDIWREAVHPDDADNLLETWISCTQNSKDFTAEARYRRFDGVYRWQLLRGVPLRNQHNDITKWYGSLSDIHDLVVQRIEASQRKQQMIDVMSHAEVNLFGFNSKMEINMLEGSIKWGSVSKVKKTSFVGSGLADVIHRASEGDKAGGTDFIQMVQRILSGESKMEILEHLVDNKWYRTRIIADLNHDNPDAPVVCGALGLSIDVTDMKARTALEIEKTQLVAKEHAAKEASRLKSQFLANMSHEIRTPIAGVLGMSDLLLATLLEYEQREYVMGIQQSAESLLTIVNDVLDFSKIESGHFEIEDIQFDLVTVLKDFTMLMGHAAQRKGLIFELKTTLGNHEQVIGDPGRIRQILMNLMTNAIKFTNKGNVTLSVTTIEYPDAVHVFFVVEDTGIGIEKEVLRKLFRPFSQGDSSTARLYGGTGLGLTISKELATMMHGIIGLESVPGVGSKATFAVPLRKPFSRRCLNGDSPSTQTRTVVPPTSHTSLSPNEEMQPQIDGCQDFSQGGIPTSDNLELSSSARAQTLILIVEDNTINQNIAVKTVQKLGFPVKAVWNGKEALDYLANPTPDTPRPHIIIMDCQMPVMDGYQATREIRKPVIVNLDPEVQNIPVIALTASAIKGDWEKCLAAGMDDYVTKPVKKKDLEVILVRWALKTWQTQNQGSAL